MSIIGYHKIDVYIITIETEIYNTYIKIDNVTNFDSCLYETKKFSVIDIEDLIGNKYDQIFNFIVDEYYEFTDTTLEFYRIKSIAFCHEFIFKEQWNYFPNGYAGYYEEYLLDGSKLVEYFHVNGIRFGEYKSFYKNGSIQESLYYVDNKIISS